MRNIEPKVIWCVVVATAFGLLTERQASADPVGSIRGHVDGKVTLNGQRYISGWSCGYRDSRSIDVHLYLGGQAGQGRYAGEYPANLPAEPAVTALCESGSAAHRFLIPITVNLLSP